MAVKSVVVKRVFVKDYPEEKVTTLKDGKVIKAKCKISFQTTEEEWFNMGDCLYSRIGAIYTKDGDITEGAELDVQYTEREYNGKTYRDTKKSKVTITKKGVFVDKNQQPAKGDNYSSHSSGSPNPAAVGQVINLAVSLGMVKKAEDLLDTEIAKKAIDLVKQSKDLYTRLWTEEPKKEAKVASAVVIDNDIPF